MFTGRLPHELDVKWNTPLRTDFPTLAEYLGSQGYATAGFVANTQYCSYDTGWTAASRITKTTSLISSTSGPCGWPCSSNAPGTGVSKAGYVAQPEPVPTLYSIGSWPPIERMPAAMNREFLDWLSHRQGAATALLRLSQLLRCPCALPAPEGTRFRFGPGPRTVADFLVLVELWKAIDKLKAEPALYQT